MRDKVKNIQFSPALIDQLDRIRKEKRQTFSEVVREACRVYVEEQELKELKRKEVTAK